MNGSDDGWPRLEHEGEVASTLENEVVCLFSHESACARSVKLPIHFSKTFLFSYTQAEDVFSWRATLRAMSSGFSTRKPLWIIPSYVDCYVVWRLLQEIV
jgi:hypothetical protein